MRLFLDPESLRFEYHSSPLWLKQLMNASRRPQFFLYKHPEVKPRVLTHFEPWMALSFTEGTSAAISSASVVRDLAVLYGDSGAAASRGRRR